MKVQGTKFLGVVIDCHLNWSKHINYIKTKVSKGIGIINRIKQFINKETLRTLYFSFVYPYLYYSIVVWGNAQDCYRDTIVKLQKRAVRIISCSPLLAHSEPLFIHLKYFNLKSSILIRLLFLCPSMNIISHHQSSIIDTRVLIFTTICMSITETFTKLTLDKQIKYVTLNIELFLQVNLLEFRP